MKILRYLPILLATASSVIITADALARDVKHEFTGIVTESTVAGVDVGDPMTATLILDDEQIPSLDIPGRADYPDYNFECDFGGELFSEDPGSTVIVLNDQPSDAFLTNGTGLGFCGFNVTDSSGMAFDNTAVPTSLDISDFTSNFLAVGGASIIGAITSIESTSVEPLPPSEASKCYFGRQIPPFNEDNLQLPFPTIDRVLLNDQFASRETDVRFLQGLCNPAGKNAPVNTERKDHLSCYSISDAPGQPLFFPGLVGEIQIETENFGEDTIKLGHALELCVSASKNGQFADIGDFKCYSARSAQSDFPEITLDDQFFANKPATIERLSRFCTPVGKDQPAPPEDPEAFDHLACYDIGRDRLQPQIEVDLTDMIITNAVGQDITFTAEFERRFCEPAKKISP